MISLKLIYKILFVSILTIALVSCSDPWSDRETNDENLKLTLKEAILNNPETSKFAEALVKTGYDKVLASSLTYTVFVPTNDAMDQVPVSILNNTDNLVLFVSNHITPAIYSTVRDKASEKIIMYSNKYLTFSGTNTIGDATITTPDQYAKNGVFHIVNKPLTPKLNIWEYVNSVSSSSAMSKYLVSLTELNIYKADSIAKLVTAPGVYADSLSNSYLRNVYNLNNEKNSYTLFLMDDGSYTTEVDKLKPYLIKNNAARSDTYASYFTVRDMAFPKAYLPNELPNELTTRFGVKIPIDKTQIIGSPIVLSNGIIYRMKKMDVTLENRLLTKIIEGENNTSYFPSTSGNRATIFYRDRKDLANILYNDIAQYHRVTEGPNFFINYTASDMYSTKYKVYWRAINEQSNVFQQRLIVGSVFKADGTIDLTTSLMAFPYMGVDIKKYDEVYIGEFPLAQAGDINTISLVAAATTTIGNNSLTLDYLKFVPVIK